jgi:hypothetical protein
VKLNQKNKFVRFILRAIERIIAFEMRRKPQNDEEPFQKATDRQKRIGGFFMATWPVFVAIYFGWIGLSVVMTERYGRYSLILLYAVLICVTYTVVFASFKIAPKTPLSVSVPIAIAIWSVIAWFVARWIWKQWF